MSAILAIPNEELESKVITAVYPKAIYSTSSLWIVVLSEDSINTSDEATRLLNPLFYAQNKVKFTVFTCQQLSNEVKKGNLFLCTSLLPENLIYNREIVTIPDLDFNKRSEFVSRATTHFHFGVGRSGSFLEGGAFYFAKREFPLAMFMLHQTTELLLRGVLTSFTNHNLRTHSISDFNNKIRKCIPKLVFLEDDGLEEKCLLGYLDYSYSSARYNVVYKVDEENVLQLFERIRAFTNVAIQNFNAMISSFKIAYPLNNPYEK